MKTPIIEITPVVQEEIIRSLRKLGAPVHVKGYVYIKSALEILLNKPEALEGITKDLYPTIARMHTTTPSRVERAIRHAVELIYDRNDPDTINNLLGPSHWSKGKLTNSEFLAVVAENLRLSLDRCADLVNIPVQVNLGLDDKTQKEAEEARLLQLRQDLITLGVLTPNGTRGI